MIVSTTRLIVMIQDECLSSKSTVASSPFLSPLLRAAFSAGTVLSLLNWNQPKKEVRGSSLSRATAAAIMRRGRIGNINRSSYDSQDKKNVTGESRKNI